MKWIRWLLLLSLLAGCVTGHVIKESSRSIDEIRAAILYVMGGNPRFVSESRREYISTYFPRTKDPKFDPQKAPERLYAKMTILGDRRPYDIQIQVVVEEQDDGRFRETGLDDGLSNQLAFELKKRLHEGRGDRNAIDDFRVF